MENDRNEAAWGSATILRQKAQTIPQRTRNTRLDGLSHAFFGSHHFNSTTRKKSFPNTQLQSAWNSRSKNAWNSRSYVTTQASSMPSNTFPSSAPRCTTQLTNFYFILRQKQYTWRHAWYFCSDFVHRVLYWKESVAWCMMMQCVQLWYCRELNSSYSWGVEKLCRSRWAWCSSVQVQLCTISHFIDDTYLHAWPASGWG